MRSQNLIKKATIKNSRLCKELEGYGYYVVFDEDRNTYGWDYVENGTLYGVSNNIYFLSALGPSPSLSRSTNLPPIDADKYTHVVIKYKYKKNRKDSVADKGKIQFITGSDPILDSTKSIDFDVISDDKWHTYNIDMSSNSGWVGQIVNLKIIFATNGTKDDEIYLQHIRIEKSKFIIDSNYYSETSEVEIADNFDLYDLNSIPSNYAISNTSSSKEVKIILDPENTNNKCLSLKNITGATSGPTVTKVLPSLAQNGFFSCRFRVNALSGNFILQNSDSLPAIALKIDTDGKLKYRSGASYINFPTPQTVQLKQWYNLFIIFNGDTGFWDIYIDSILIGKSISYVSLGQLKSLIIEVTTANTLYIDNLQLVEQIVTETECIGIGKQGSITGTNVYFNKLSIIENINDTLIVNINNYGDIIIKLPVFASLSCNELRDLLEKEISTLDIGGYVNVEVIYTDNHFIIFSGTYGFDSTVQVKKYGNSTLAEDLGLLNGSQQSGRPHAAGVGFFNTFRAKTINLSELKLDRSNNFLFQNPTLPAVEIGSRFAEDISRKNKIAGNGKTIIDYSHRGTNDGVIDQIYFYGELPTSSEVKLIGLGYLVGNTLYTNVNNIIEYNIQNGDIVVLDKTGFSGNGSYVIINYNKSGALQLDGIDINGSESNIDFSINSIPKIKQFRSKYDGTLDLINEVSLGQRDSGVLYTRAGDSYYVKVGWEVHRGDLIGIYNANYIYTGQDTNNNSESLYLEYSGDLVGNSVTVDLQPKGIDVKGIGLYGKSLVKQGRAAYDIEFNDPTSIDFLELKGKHKLDKIEYNLGNAINSGFSLSAIVSGTHIHRIDDINGQPQDVSHPNITYNAFALTDGKKYASNGVLGTFEQNDSRAMYFYISGDSEFAGYKFDSAGHIIENSLEFPIGEWPSGGYYGDQFLYTHDYKNDLFSFNTSWNVPKLIFKYRIYFKEFPNVWGYYLEWLNNHTFEKVGSGSSSYYTKVKLDNKTVTLEQVSVSGQLSSTDVLRHQFESVVDTYPGSTNTEGAAEMQALQRFPYTVLEKEFTPIQTKAINWNCLFHDSTKISEFELLSFTESSGDLKSIAAVYVSEDGSEFKAIIPEEIDSETIRLVIGSPIKTIRLMLEPEAELEVKSIYIEPSSELIEYTEEVTDKEISAVDIDIIKGGFSTPKQINIINSIGVTASVDISIDTKEIENSILLKTSLNNLDSIKNPEIGPPGQLTQDPDKKLTVTKNIAINADCYGLKNIASNKKYYVSSFFECESDAFITSINGNKWKEDYTNYPSGHIELVYPGLCLRPKAPYTEGYPDVPMKIELTSSWITLGEFNAFITAAYDAGYSKASPMGAAIGIVDSTGRKIYISKNRTWFTGSFSVPETNKAWISITDSATGNLDTVNTFCVAGCSSTFGTNDDNIEYTLGVTRVKHEFVDELRFYYIDPVNGTGAAEWNGASYFSVDLTKLSTPINGYVKVFIDNFWNPDSVYAAHGSPATFTYNKINKFSFGGESTYPYKQYSFTQGHSIGSNGEIRVDNVSSSLGKEKLIAVDLGKIYTLDIVQNYSNVLGISIWSNFKVQYSDTDTDKPELVVWGNSDRLKVKWLLFSEVASSVIGLKYLYDLRIYQSINEVALNTTADVEWVYLNNILTDGDLQTTVSQIQHPIVAIKLENNFNVENFKILDKNGLEYPANNNFNGWSSNAEYSMSTSNTSNIDVVSWDIWRTYEEPKYVINAQWFAFRNKNFSTIGPTTAQYISNFEVQTNGTDTSNTGEVVDNVDFTEYSKWFDILNADKVNVAPLSDEDINEAGKLYGTSNASYTTNDSSNIFDDNHYTNGRLYAGTSMYVWRRFGTITATGTQIYYPFGDYQIPSEIIPSEVLIGQVKNICGFLLDVAQESPCLPKAIEVQALSGTDPLNNSHWMTVYSGSNLATIEGIDNNQEYVFNGGSSLNVTLNSPVSTSGIRLVVTDRLDLANPNNELYIIINELSIYESSTYSTSNNITIENDINVKSGGRRSLKINVTGNNTTLNLIDVGESFYIEPDSLWSIQDFIKFYIKVDKPNLIDFDKSYIRLGKNKSQHFEWKLSSLKDSIDINLTKQTLRFKDANFINVITTDEMFEDDVSISKFTITTQPIEFLEFELGLLNTVTDTVSVWLDSFGIEREVFTLPGKYANTLYLNNAESIYFPVANFNMRKGSFECIITPDWDGYPDGFIEDVYTIMTAINDLEQCFSVWYSSTMGLTFSFTSASVRDRLMVGLIPDIKKDKPFKLAFYWNADDGRSMSLWIDDKFYGNFNYSWEMPNTENSYLFIGSKVPDVAPSTLSQELASTNDMEFKIIPNKIGSITGGIENLIISSESYRMSYDSIQTLKDKLYISIDGVNYYSGTSTELPITVTGVLPGESVNLWVKTNLPNKLNNLSREGYIRTRWRIAS